MAFGSLLSDDIFISYSRGDGGDYVRRLDQELTQRGFSCFTDHKGTHASKVLAARAQAEDPTVPAPDDEEEADLPEALCRKIRSAKMLIFVGSPNALKRQKYIKRELKEFDATNSTLRIVPISFDRDDDTMTDWTYATWWHYVAEKTRVRERAGALAPGGGPSKEVVDSILEMVNYTKSKDRLRRYRNGALALFLLLLTGSVVAASFGVRYAKAAQTALQRATEAETEADARKVIAMTQVYAAEALSAVAEAERVTAVAAAAKARKDADAADAAAKAAEAKRLAAEKLKREAEAQRQLAEAAAKKQQGVAGSRQRANEAAGKFKQGPGDLVAGVEDAIASVASASDVGVHTVESDAAIRRGLGLLPSLRPSPAQTFATYTRCAAFTPDAKVFARAGEGDELLGYVGADPVKKWPLLRQGCGSLALSRDAGRIAVASNKTIQVIDSAKGDVVQEFDLSDLKGEPAKAEDAPAPAGAGRGNEGEAGQDEEEVEEEDEEETDNIKSVALSPDGSLLAVVTIGPNEAATDEVGAVTLMLVGDKTVKGSKKRLAVLSEGLRYRFSEVAFSPKGAMLAAGGRAICCAQQLGVAVLWNLREVRSMVRERAKTADEKVSAADLFGLAAEEDFRLVRSVSRQGWNVLSIAPGDEPGRFAVGGSDSVIVWKTDDAGQLEPSAYLPLPERPYKLALSGDGSALSLYRGQSPDINEYGHEGDPEKTEMAYQVWDAEGYSTAESRTFDDSIASVAYTDDGGLLIEGGGIGVSLWKNLLAEKPAATFDRASLPKRADPRCPFDDTMSAAGGRFVFIQQCETSYLRDVLGGQTYPIPNFNIYKNHLRGISKDGSLYVISPDPETTAEGVNWQGTAAFYVRKGNAYVKAHSVVGITDELSVSDGGGHVAFVDKKGIMHIWSRDGRDSTPLRSKQSNSIVKLKISKTGRYVAGVTFLEGFGTDTPQMLNVWSAAGGPPLNQVRHVGAILDFEFSGDDAYVATAGIDKFLKVVKIGAAGELAFAHSRPVQQVVFDRRSRRVAAATSDYHDDSEGSVVYVYDLKEKIRAVELRHRELVGLMAFSPDGELLVTSGSIVPPDINQKPGPPRVKVWRIAAERLVDEARERLKTISGR